VESGQWIRGRSHYFWKRCLIVYIFSLPGQLKAADLGSAGSLQNGGRIDSVFDKQSSLVGHFSLVGRRHCVLAKCTPIQVPAEAPISTANVIYRPHRNSQRIVPSRGTAEVDQVVPTLGEPSQKFTIQFSGWRTKNERSGPRLN